MPDQSFGRHSRIRKPAEFERVYRTKLFAADDVLLVNAAASDLLHPRLGLAVSKRAGNAVTRNRWKRVIREAFRMAKDELPPGIDLVVRPQKDAAAELAAVRRSLVALAGRLARRMKRDTESPRIAK